MASVIRRFHSRDSQDYIVRLKKDISERLSHAIEAGTGRFAPRNDLKRIWTPEILGVLVLGGWWDGSLLAFVEEIHAHFLQTISILIYVGWDDWSRFYEIFFSHRDADEQLCRTDRRIPEYDVQTLKKDDFLGPSFGSKFFDNRYFFCPIDIEEGSHLKFGVGWKLPFLAGKSSHCGIGGSGIVTKEVIAVEHYRSEAGTHLTEKHVARKLFKSKDAYDKEDFNLTMISKCDNQNVRIILPLATVVIEGQYNMLLPPAKMDLDRFLTGELLSPNDCHMDKLLEELIGLGGALAYLHEGLGQNIRTCHADLKTANILVYDDLDSNGRPGVGKWAITDFGHSVIYRTSAGHRDSACYLPNEASVSDTIAELRDMRGVYQAPEVLHGHMISRTSDIWSFGCILVRVFAFKLDGVQGLRRLDELRRKEDDEVTDCADDYFCKGGSGSSRLNSHVEKWIKRLPDRNTDYSGTFLENCKDLLLRMLCIDRNHRLQASEVIQRLEELRSILHTFSFASPTPNLPRGSITSSSNSMQSPGLSGSDWSSRVSVDHTAPIGVLPHTRGNTDDDIIRRLSSPNAETRSSNRGSNIPLYDAVGQGSVKDVTSLLMDEDTQIDERCPTGETPLMLAVRLGRKDIVGLLLGQGADCRAYSEEGMMCLHYATRPDASVGLMRLLIQKLQHVDIPMEGLTRETPLMTLIKQWVPATASCKGKFRALVDAGADINLPDIYGVSPLQQAVALGYREVVELLLENNAEINEAELSTIAQTNAVEKLWRNALEARRHSGRSRHWNRLGIHRR
ncbi:uncharacterized protein TRUGW13939_05144 [Talaromyces rugulosus]|uniref:Protein kinase domain-containing protein n=1 Tax=Talaromyces rugulosus TaxID=121627 RepID=A0A7H8QVI3_TALRU|nr:uncharacterized protein TRUGW13939_05144 [Talaromyces rugulosus]QKX58024.1 hypothetical protein TRUGW13939_05144 [Talaromyces rugulosus]